MSTVHTALGIRRSHKTPHRMVDPPNEHKENKPVPPPPSETLEGWTSEHPYRYFTQGGPEDAWRICNEAVERHDEKFCNRLKEEINFLMVVAGLFLAIVTAFTIESYKLLQEDKQDTMSDLLVQVVRLLNDTSTQGHALLPKRFTPDHHQLVVNKLWFLSMILSLVAVLIGTFCLQWISAFLRGRDRDRKDKSTSPTEVLGIRHLRYEGFVGWGVSHAPEVLLLIVQLSIAFFTAGLIYFLWNIDHIAAIPALVVAGITGVLLYLVNLMPFLQSLVGVFFPAFLTHQCPYKSPTSWLVRSACNMFALILKPLQKWCDGHDGVVARFSEWLAVLPMPLTDYLWKDHDLLHSRFQHSWHVRSRLRSLAKGIFSGLDILVLEPNAVDIIRRPIQSICWMFSNAQNLEAVFGQRLSPLEKELLDGEGVTWYNTNLAVNSADQQLYFTKFIGDLKSALIVQNLVYDSMKLGRILLPHRVELYIRIKNSMLFVFKGAGGACHQFGIFLDSPLSHYEAEALDLDLRFQFLNYMKHFWSSGFRIPDNDYLVTAEIIRIEGTRCLNATWCSICSRLQQLDLGACGPPGTEADAESDAAASNSGSTEGSPHEPIPPDGQSPGTRETDIASSANDVHELGRGDHDADEKKGAGNGSYNNLSGPQHTDPQTEVDHKLPSSSQHGVNEQKVQDARLRASLRRLCLELKEQLLHFAASLPQDESMKSELQYLLRPVHGPQELHQLPPDAIWSF